MTNYPDSFDDDETLYAVHDSLRVRLAEDYTPGDTTITVEGDAFDTFPDTGLITLTDQCADIDERALTFSYTSKGTNTFVGLELLDGFTDVVKSKRITNVTQNVVAEHHNSLKDALIAVETFVGIEGATASTPLTGTMEQRINFLSKLVFRPRAWFTVEKNIGLYPFTATFNDLSFRSVDTWIWDFGDGVTTTLSSSGSTTHAYSTPDKYDVTLTVINDYGSDSMVFPNCVNVRTLAPDEATLTFTPDATQSFSGGVLHSKNNKSIIVDVNDDGEQALDDITDYTWDFGDDLTHANADTAKAMYRVGGLYDIRLRVDTTLGAYRITNFSNVIDITETVNLWLFLCDPDALTDAITKDVYGYEFGLISETFKVATREAVSVTRDYNFLVGKEEEDQQIAEFKRNNGFNPRTLVSSGERGTAVIYYSEGAADDSDPQYIRFLEYNAFDDVWTEPAIDAGTNGLLRNWNWFSLNGTGSVYFLLGSSSGFGSPTLQDFTTLDLSTYTSDSEALSSSFYTNGADELQNNVGDGASGDFSVYRTTWKDSNGYIIRNDGTGIYFRFKSFYQTEGLLSNPIQLIRKMTDMPGSPKLEGQLVTLSNGVYFFNNSGEVVVYNPTTNSWASGGPGVNSSSFSALQDNTVADFDSTTQRLLATSDGDRSAYLSYDYSRNAMIKFNELDLTFTILPQRPAGEQFLMGVF